VGAKLDVLLVDLPGKRADVQLTLLHQIELSGATCVDAADGAFD